MGPVVARDRVEQADFLLMLGVTLNDVDLGIYSAKLDAKRIVRASQDEVIIHHHRYSRVLLRDFLAALNQRLMPASVIGCEVAANRKILIFRSRDNP